MLFILNIYDYGDFKSLMANLESLKNIFEGYKLDLEFNFMLSIINALIPKFTGL